MSIRGSLCSCYNALLVEFGAKRYLGIDRFAVWAVQPKAQRLRAFIPFDVKRHGR